MRIAIPITNGSLADHFGHSEQFAFVDIDPSAKKIVGSADVNAPEHQPGLLPGWLAERGVNLVIAGRMGSSAEALLEAASIPVLAGVSGGTASALVEQYLAGALTVGTNHCDHSVHDACH